jgi:prevent-host-death family protein
MDTKHIAAGQFKQKCLAIIDDVARTHQAVIITKRGKPIARLMPLETDREIEDRILAKLRSGDGGMLVSEEEFLAPTQDIAGWNNA